MIVNSFLLILIPSRSRTLLGTKTDFCVTTANESPSRKQLSQRTSSQQLQMFQIRVCQDQSMIDVKSDRASVPIRFCILCASFWFKAAIHVFLDYPVIFAKVTAIIRCTLGSTCCFSKRAQHPSHLPFVRYVLGYFSHVALGDIEKIINNDFLQLDAG